MEVYIIRHAQSTNNALMDDQHMRVEDPPLTEVGHQQAERLSAFLATAPNLEDMVRHKVDAPERTSNDFPQTITHLYCSPMHRALQTVIRHSDGLRSKRGGQLQRIDLKNRELVYAWPDLEPDPVDVHHGQRRNFGVVAGGDVRGEAGGRRRVRVGVERYQDSLNHGWSSVKQRGTGPLPSYPRGTTRPAGVPTSGKRGE